MNHGKNYKKRIGKFGEDLAKNFLIKRGYKIIGTNIKTSYKEIDIIAQSGKSLIFVEVKTRLSSIYGYADEALTTKKLYNLNIAAGIFLNNNDNNINFSEVRIDLIAVDIIRSKKIAKIKHYINVI